MIVNPIPVNYLLFLVLTFIYISLFDNWNDNYHNQDYINLN